MHPAEVTQHAFEDAVHVWAVDLRPSGDEMTRLFDLLAPEECKRARSFRSYVDRDRYVIAHAAVRKILGSYVNVPPENIRFALGRSGKPSIANPSPTTINFSLSHSRDIGLVAVGHHQLIGVDIEWIQEDLSVLDLAATCFSPDEQAELSRTSGSDRVESFFRCWSRKEAYIKATGDGLSAPLKEFTVSICPKPALLLGGYDSLGVRWALADLPVGPSFAGALAVSDFSGQPSCWCYSDLQ